ncbi:hypothetical protein quinque_015036 [Culex quinquefasciatus]
MSSSPYMNNINNSSGTSASGGGHHHNNNHNNSQEYGADLLLDGGAPGESNNHHAQNDPFLEDGPMMMGGAAAGALDDDNVDDSEEDTEEASETEMGSSSNHRNADEPIEIKEQMYQDKLASLKKQLDELRSGTHPEYLRRVKKLEHQYSERIRLNEIYREYLINCVERDYILEKNAAVKEYEEKKVDLKENLMTDFEDRRKMIETERATMELTGDSVDVKPTITRKLRRRPNEPLPVPEKRRKPTTGQLVLLLDEKEVENDLKLISRGKAAQVMRNHQQQQQANGGSGSGSSNSHTQIAPITNNGTASIVNNSVVAPSSTIPTPTPLINASYQINSSSVGSSVAAPSTTTTATPSSTVTSSELTLALPQSTTTPAVSSSPVVAASQPSPVATQPQTAPTTTTTPVNGQPPMAAVVPVASQQNSAQPAPLVETRIEDGKLLYERRWFHRGQPVYVEGRDIQRFSANISAIGSEAIWVKKTSDGQKVRIFTNQLSRGKVSIKRRAN